MEQLSRSKAKRSSVCARAMVAVFIERVLIKSALRGGVPYCQGWWEFQRVCGVEKAMQVKYSSRARIGEDW